MAISTSSQSVYLPGLDTTLQNGMNDSLNTSPTMLNLLLNSNTTTGIANSTSSVNALKTKLTTDFVGSDPLPTFAFFSNYGNTPGYAVYDSDMQPIHGGNLNTDFEISQAFTGWNYTNSTIGQGSAGSYWVGATPYSQADGNWLVTVPGQRGGDTAGYGKNKDVIRGVYPYFGVVIGARGERAKFSLLMSGTTIGIYPRGGISPIEQLNLNTSTYSTWANTNNTNIGMVGYNDRTRRLVVIEPKDAANSYRVHIWKNNNRPLNTFNMDVGTLHQFLSEAKTAGTPATVSSNLYYYYNDFTWQQDNSQNYTESRYRMMITVGDNEYIGMSRFTPSNITRYATFLPNIAATSGTLATLNGVANTTSYGWDNGNDYGIRHQITWDNDWVASYSPYYYYGCGMNVIFSNVSDPRNYYTGQNGGTGHGCTIVPFKENKFLFNHTENNSDGNAGGRLWVVDVGGIKTTGFNNGGGAVTNGSAISLQPSTFLYSFDTRYTGTNYPVLISPDMWTNG